MPGSKNLHDVGPGLKHLRMRSARIILCTAVVLAPLMLAAQHDPGRNAVRELAKGDGAAAEKALAKQGRNNSPIDEAERHFVRALSASLKGDGAVALGEARRAVAKGAQVGRFIAGPADAWAALRRAEGYAAWIASFDLPLVHGPMLGDVSAESARVWLRTAGAGTVTLKATGEGRTHTVRLQTTARTAYTGVARFDGLRAGTAYEVSVQIGDREIEGGSFRTLRQQGAPGRLTLVFGGGAGFTPKYERMWSTIEGHRPDALFLLGDNVYIDDPTHLLTHHYVYNRRQSQPEWRSLVLHTPVYAIYDDHDFGLNDCIPGPFVDKPAWKREVWEVFRQNWANPAYGGGDAKPGCWFDTYLGDIHFICLDGRCRRTGCSGR
jgi:alkaline phosphatase D